MQPRTETTEENRAVIWCEKCGIPYADTLTHCSLCGAPLADELAAPTAGTVPAPVSVTTPDPEELREDVPPVASRLAAEPPTSAPALRLGRLRQRPRPLSEVEVEAAAAAIIARAREEIANGAAEPGPRDALALLPDLVPDPAIEQALLKRQERDRLWLIAGVVCSILLILVAIAVSRYVQGGLPTT